MLLSSTYYIAELAWSTKTGKDEKDQESGAEHVVRIQPLLDALALYCQASFSQHGWDCFLLGGQG